jgi:NitT/TauT family transport system substrate-binding protein
MRIIKILSLLIGVLFLAACGDKAPEKTIRIGINPWPGYEFIYLAEQKGFFQEEGLKIELLELASLADVSRVFRQGRIDGMTSTMVEAVDIASNADDQFDIILLTDFSTGSDVIAANKPISSIAGLKGKKVGVELDLLGSFILAQALEQQGLSTNDVTMINVEQLEAEAKLLSKGIDAMVTYAPFSTHILKQDSVQAIFTTAEIPEKVIDIVVLRHGVLDNATEWQQKFIKVWQRALEYAKENEGEAYRIMAEREGVTVEEFREALKGITIVGAEKQLPLMRSDLLTTNMLKICEILKSASSTVIDCQHLNDKLKPLILRGEVDG